MKDRDEDLDIEISSLRVVSLRGMKGLHETGTLLILKESAPSTNPDLLPIDTSLTVHET